MKINWKVRFNKKNIMFIAQVALAVIMPILMYFGLEAKDITSWKVVGQLILEAIKNPYVVVMTLANLFNAVTDPTTKGIGDSKAALTYTEPKK